MCKQIFSLSEKIKKKKEAENLRQALGNFNFNGHNLLNQGKSRNLCCNDFKLCL